MIILEIAGWSKEHSLSASEMFIKTALIGEAEITKAAISFPSRMHKPSKNEQQVTKDDCEAIGNT